MASEFLTYLAATIALVALGVSVVKAGPSARRNRRAERERRRRSEVLPVMSELLAASSRHAHVESATLHPDAVEAVERAFSKLLPVAPPDVAASAGVVTLTHVLLQVTVRTTSLPAGSEELRDLLRDWEICRVESERALVDAAARASLVP